MKVNIISESVFTVQGHGVHTAFEEHLHSLQKVEGCDVAVNTNRPADIIHLHTVGPYSVRKLLFCKGRKVFSAHVTPDSFVGSLVGAKYWYPLAKLYLRWVYNRCDAVMAVSQEVVGELKAMGVKKPIFLLPNTIDIAQFSNTPALRAAGRRHLKLNPNQFVIMSSGQVQPRKRVDTFVDCARALPEYEFVWVGGMPFKGVAANHREMEKLMQSKLPNLRFTGQISREDVVAYYRAADLFFLPSMQETFGIVVVEGAAAGLPVLLRDIPQYRDTFKDWYIRGEEGNFVQQIQEIATDSKLYQNYKEKSALLAQEYDAAAGAKRLIGIYQQVLGG